jgi:glyoxylase-like metal-dependent hydrolase (beta-lactamase superfamily II)
MKKGISCCAALLAGFCCLIVTKVQAGTVESSYRTARNIIGEAITATGAGQWLDTGGPVLIESLGERYPAAERQGRSPDDESSIEFHETWAFDPDRGRLGREIRYRRPDGTLVWQRELFFDQRSLLIDLDKKQVTEFQGREVDRRRAALLRRWVPTLLAEAEDNPSALRAIGRYGPFDGVQTITNDGQSLSLFFGRESRNPGWVEYLADLPSFADSTVSWKFSDYRPVTGLGQVPHEWAVLVNEQLLVRMDVLRAIADQDQVRAFLALPDEMKLESQDSFITSPAHIRDLGEGVYLVVEPAAKRQTLLVEFQESMLMIDAPAVRPALLELPAQLGTGGSGETSMSRRAMKLAAETVPGKPITAALLTHFHSDSAGGLRALAENELLVYAHASETETLQEFLENEHTLCAETSPLAETTVVTIDERLVLEDDTQKVVIINTGDNPHTENMLVVWLPKQRILFTTDLLTAIDGKPNPAQPKLNRFFKGWLLDSGLDPELILTAHGNGEIRTETLISAGLESAPR